MDGTLSAASGMSEALLLRCMQFSIGAPALPRPLRTPETAGRTVCAAAMGETSADRASAK